MTIDTWKTLISSLPTGLTITEAVGILGENYSSTRAYLHKFGYKFKDGRLGHHSERCKVDWDAMDWRQANIDIKRFLMREKGISVSKERVRVARLERKKPLVEARGRSKPHDYKKKPKKISQETC